MRIIKYQWLESLLNIDEEIIEVQTSRRINQLELKRWESYDDGSKGDLARTQKYLESLKRQEDLKKVIEDLNQREEQLKKQREEVISLIDKFEGLDHDILKLKYVHGMTLESVAHSLGYDHQYIKNKHAQILKMVRFAKKL